jgi:UDP-glucose 4-epimerase
MKILITGSNGYIGSKLTLALKEKGHEVEGFDKPNDICKIVQVKKAIKGKDVVYHLAALAELSYTDAHPQETYDVNIEGTNNIARICAENGVMLNFTSTCCIYGNPLEKPSQEGKLINPSDTYAISKVAGEYLVKMWGLAKGLKYNILRFGTVYGQSTDKNMRSDMAIQKFVKAAVEHLPITITGDGTQVRNFMHIDDLIRGLVAVTEKRVAGETINLCGKERTSIKDIATLLEIKDITYAPARKDDFTDQDVSIEKAKRLLDWQPIVEFKDGLKSMKQWQERP